MKTFIDPTKEEAAQILREVRKRSDPSERRYEREYKYGRFFSSTYYHNKKGERTARVFRTDSIIDEISIYYEESGK